MRFVCPHCGSPYAELSCETAHSDDDLLDSDDLFLDSGAQHCCVECGGIVIFEAMTIETYTAYCQWAAANVEAGP